METSAKPSNNHIGRKIGRIREMRGIKQDTLATELGISQQAISRIEQSETIEDEVLEKIAKILGVTTEAIKNFTEEAVVNYFNNTFHGSNHGPFYHCTFNPLDKLLELVEENKKLYERLVQAEREKNDLLTSK
ncbi:helix-turn-helix domain-containing protein [Mucilaginibacter sp. L3T2-6]|uniref:helix-turn-helix domain-containing protein n=1 Tax=Mucilaginibacter sp. L3T2-6 TaxID=3062491 RepID=UPI00267446BF|nr:helix-turn-helix transcriptional regulator [Mucilaginibacter sp. L3T2-6]MDO3645292.1 helix-turn-helix transcriptional regulator [Mucilaginibacter sp. L3T2-6]MDV6217807.1 helix-turn-helix transcriptional regulator [Mucilaginibacter sp. L3T2-6]